MHKRHSKTKIAAVYSPQPSTYIERSQHRAALHLDVFPLTHILSNTWLKEKTSLQGRQKTKAGLNKRKNRSASMSVNKLLNSVRGRSIHYL